MNGHSLRNPFLSSFRLAVAGLVILLAVFLCFLVPPGLILVPVVGAAFVFVLLAYPVSALGFFLALMPIHFLPVMIGRFYGVPHMTLISACTKEVPLLVLTVILWRRNPFRLTAPDWFLFGCFLVAAIRTAFSGEVVGLLLDFEFIVAYLLGRATLLSDTRERSWATNAVWICAVLSLLGMFEVFVLGDGPRKILYALVTQEGELPSSFGAVSWEGLRAASTLVGPPSLAALCMIALIIWWVYLRNPLPAAIIAAGLVCALTRSAWIGTVGGITVLAFRLQQKKRLLVYASIAMAAFIVAIPFLDISDYVFHSSTGKEESEQVHRESELRGLQYVITHPFGSGAATVGAIALAKNENAVVTENTYLSLAAQYGVPASLCFMAFLFSLLCMAWRKQGRLAHATVGILIAFGLMMIVFLVHEDFRLATWVWFPVGLFVRTASPNKANV